MVSFFSRLGGDIAACVWFRASCLLVNVPSCAECFGGPCPDTPFCGINNVLKGSPVPFVGVCVCVFFADGHKDLSRRCHTSPLKLRNVLGVAIIVPRPFRGGVAEKHRTFLFAVE